jgi:hypothetical protein
MVTFETRSHYTRALVGLGFRVMVTFETGALHGDLFSSVNPRSY